MRQDLGFKQVMDCNILNFYAIRNFLNPSEIKIGCVLFACNAAKKQYANC